MLNLYLPYERSRKGKKTLSFKGARGLFYTKQQRGYGFKFKKKHFEDKSIIIPNDPALIADLHAIKQKAGAKSFIYDSDRNKHGHADRFWALALALSYFEKVI